MLNYHSPIQTAVSCSKSPASNVLAMLPYLKRSSCPLQSPQQAKETRLKNSLEVRIDPTSHDKSSHENQPRPLPRLGRHSLCTCEAHHSDTPCMETHPRHPRRAHPGAWPVGSDGARQAGARRAQIQKRSDWRRASSRWHKLPSHHWCREQGWQGRQVLGDSCSRIDREACPRFL